MPMNEPPTYIDENQFVQGAVDILMGRTKSADAGEKAAQQKRASQYGIGVKDDGNVTKPGRWSDVPDSKWGDPVNYKLPMPDAAHARNASSRMAQAAFRSGYSDAELAKIEGRVRGVEKSLGIGSGTEDSGNKKTEKALKLMPDEGDPHDTGTRKGLQMKTQQERAAACGIAIKVVDAPVPEGLEQYIDEPTMWGDWTNYQFPLLDPDTIIGSIEAMQTASGYSAPEAAAIHKAVLTRQKALAEELKSDGDTPTDKVTGAATETGTSVTDAQTPGTEGTTLQEQATAEEDGTVERAVQPVFEDAALQSQLDDAVATALSTVYRDFIEQQTKIEFATSTPEAVEALKGVGLERKAKKRTSTRAAQLAHDHLASMNGVWCAENNLNPNDPDNDGDNDGGPGGTDSDDDVTSAVNKSVTSASLPRNARTGTTTGEVLTRQKSLEAQVNDLLTKVDGQQSELTRVKDAVLAREQELEAAQDEIRTTKSALDEAKAEAAQKTLELERREAQVHERERRELPDPLHTRKSVVVRRPEGVAIAPSTTREYLNRKGRE